MTNKLMTRAQAIVEQEKINKVFDATIEEGRINEAEYQRQRHETSLTCKHRQIRQWIDAGEFSLCVCSACAGLLIDALGEVG